MPKPNIYEHECLEAYNEFNPVRNFSKEIPNCEYDIEITLPEPPKDPTIIANYGKAKKNRKFPYHDWKYVKKIDSMDSMNPERKKFIDEEWRRRRNGFWWYNGDKLEWVNGHYYMTLQYWRIPIEDKDGALGNPKFVDMQRDMNLAIWHGQNDPYCAGLAYVGCRRSSKTVMGVSNGYWNTTERYNALFGIQSKTETDGKGVLRKMVLSWKYLPNFLKPTDAGLTTVTTKLEFTEPQKRNTKGKKKEYTDVLNSMIAAYPSTEYALDGLRTTFQFQDEFGKRISSDAYKTQQVSKVCCVVGSKVVGFSFWATTVEEMEKGGGEAAKKIWDEANPNNRNDNGRTVNTMYRLFFPAEYGLFEGEHNGVPLVDEWGYSNLKAAAEWIESEAKSMNQEALVDFRRKFPRNIDHAFLIETTGNSYNQHKLYQQFTYNQTLPNNFVVRGNFYWKGGMKDTEVEFSADDNGRWLVAWMPPPEDRNRKEKRNGHWFPTRDYCKTGCDPFSHRETVGKGSNGAGTTILQRHYSYPNMKMAVVCHYLHRPQHPHEFAEDMIMQSVFYSSEFLSESNKYGVLDTFHKRGYDGYCMYDPLDPEGVKKRFRGHRGIPMTGTNAREAMMDITQAYINDHMGLREDGTNGFCPFDEIIQDWRKFEPDSWTVYDSAVSIGMALIATKKVKQTQEVNLKPSDFFQKWDNSGKISKKR